MGPRSETFRKGVSSGDQSKLGMDCDQNAKGNSVERRVQAHEVVTFSRSRRERRE